MKTRTDFALVCASFMLGAVLSLRLMRFLFGTRIYSYDELTFLAPGFHLLGPAYNSTAEWLLVTAFDTIVFGGIIYLTIHGTSWLLRGVKFR